MRFRHWVVMGIDTDTERAYKLKAFRNRLKAFKFADLIGDTEVRYRR